ncbi:hypothetical protein [Paracoccus sp. KR1-242]|uniref:hypothetical protein n=1 Tax=Paracoccus sp. KR1-242 TaxID=3410028 RepID=UPI003C0036E6
MPGRFSQVRVLHAAQLALGYYYDQRRRGDTGGARVATVVTTEGYYRQAVPICHFALYTVLSLNQIRNGEMSMTAQDEAEQLVMLGLGDALNAPGGHADMHEAFLLAGFIDAQDIDMQMVGQAHDASGVVVFSFDKFEALDAAYARLRNIHRQTASVPPPKVDAVALRPSVFSVAPEAVADLPRMFDRRAAEDVILQAKLAAVVHQMR